MPLSAPLAFRLAGVHSGVKRNPTKPDLTLIVSDRPATAAGVYTTNRVFGAPVGWNRKLTPSADIRVVAVNSGVANACTGERGDRDAREMARLAAATVGAAAEQALVLSTGVIGEYLPLEKIATGLAAAHAQLGTDEAALISAARGMMTTDTVHKLTGRVLTIGRRETRLCGMAKGAAMIGPRMATMLSVLLTDAALTPAAAQETLQAAVNDTFNCISVEGHMSTSDSVLLLANGAAGDAPLKGAELAALATEIHGICEELARAIVNDGEGASHLITVDVLGCASRQAAHAIAQTVANSPLVKTAIAGADPNWGRIVSAAGYAGVPFDPRAVCLRINGLLLYERGAPAAFNAAEVSQSIRSQRDTHVELTFAEGSHKTRFWTTDLTAEYVRLNADYHT
jgi:glutamate N-acetyltransferase/amino-acid N-acetyltransferase